MEATVGGIFREHFDEYQKRYPQPLHKLKAVSAMQRCRTAEMGGHVRRCPHGHVEEVYYNSCKHRSCPQCSSLPTERWLEKQKAKLLECDHYHVVFTMPHYLIALWWCNPRRMADLLFQCATETLRELLADPKYLGATVGILATLHTWGRDLIRHPHLHCLVTGGGCSPSGQWIGVSGEFLLPYRVVRKILRAKYVAGLRKAYEAGELKLPRGLGERGFEALMSKVGRRVKWNTRILRALRSRGWRSGLSGSLRPRWSAAQPADHPRRGRSGRVSFYRSPHPPEGRAAADAGGVHAPAALAHPGKGPSRGPSLRSLPRAQSPAAGAMPGASGTTTGGGAGVSRLAALSRAIGTRPGEPLSSVRG